VLDGLSQLLTGTGPGANCAGNGARRVRTATAPDAVGIFFVTEKNNYGAIPIMYDSLEHGHTFGSQIKKGKEDDILLFRRSSAKSCYTERPILFDSADALRNACVDFRARG